MGTSRAAALSAEPRRLAEDFSRAKNWKRWGPSLPSANGAWCARITRPTGKAGAISRMSTRAAAPIAGVRTGLMGIADCEGRRCFALARWNERDPILKERLFGLSGPEGNPGKDVKECDFYLEATPTHSWHHEYFHGETRQGLGASHQSGWTALVARLIENFPG
jgi:hypothetical protein